MEDNEGHATTVPKTHTRTHTPLHQWHSMLYQFHIGFPLTTLKPSSVWVNRMVIEMVLCLNDSVGINKMVLCTLDQCSVEGGFSKPHGYIFELAIKYLQG